MWLLSMAMLLTVVGLAATATERIRIRMSRSEAMKLLPEGAPPLWENP